MIERHIDYLQFSALLSEADAQSVAVEAVPAPKFYKRGYRDASGFRYYYGNPNSKKAMIIASGETLWKARIEGKGDEFVLNWALAGDGTITRLDLAVTEYISESLILVEDIQRWFEEGLIVSNLVYGGAKLISGYDEERQAQAETLYIGSMKKRGKTGIFRAYDKGIEMDIGKYLVTRMELEMRGEKAQNTARRIARDGDISGNFRAFFNVNSPDFERVMDSPAIVPTRGEGKPKEDDEEALIRRWRWLTEQVAPSLKNSRDEDILKGHGHEREYWFLRAAGYEHEEIERLIGMKMKRV